MTSPPAAAPHPLIIEAAINGVTFRARNPHVPLAPEEIADDALRCLAAGAAIIHNHLPDASLVGPAVAEAYLAGWHPVLSARPDALLYPTVPVFGGDVLASGMARMAMERGGHVRVGLEDHAGSRQPTNVELVAEVATLARELGRPLATPGDTAKLLNLPPL